MNQNLSKNYNSVFEEYFQDFEIKSDFNKEYISLWSGWLGKENYKKLDEVTETDWNKFNILIRNISINYELHNVDLNKKTIVKIDNIEDTLSNYSDSMNKNSNEFSLYYIPELACILSEDWDYTFIIWYNNRNPIEKLKSFIDEAGLYHFA